MALDYCERHTLNTRKYMRRVLVAQDNCGVLRQVRAKTFVAVGHETANKGADGKKLRRDTIDANLLANMELGVHADAAPGRHTSDMVRLTTALVGQIISYLCKSDMECLISAWKCMNSAAKEMLYDSC